MIIIILSVLIPIVFIIGYIVGNIHYNKCVLPRKLASYVLHIIMSVDEENRNKILKTISEIKDKIEI